jgi:hypothetical protein
VQRVDLDKLVAKEISDLSFTFPLLILYQLAASERSAGYEMTARAAFERVGQMLDLRKVIRHIPQLAAASAGCRSQLLKIISQVSRRLSGDKPILTDPLVTLGFQNQPH